MIIDFFSKNPDLLMYVIIYFIAINFIGFISMALDKRKAQKGAWRIKEGSLFMITSQEPLIQYKISFS